MSANRKDKHEKDITVDQTPLHQAGEAGLLRVQGKGTGGSSGEDQMSVSTLVHVADGDGLKCARCGVALHSPDGKPFYPGSRVARTKGEFSGAEFFTAFTGDDVALCQITRRDFFSPMESETICMEIRRAEDAMERIKSVVLSLGAVENCAVALGNLKAAVEDIQKIITERN